MSIHNRAFKATIQSPRNAFVRWMDPDREAGIASGFKEAGDAVVDHAMSQIRHPDCFLFPIGFLYRHALEVQLKVLCRVGCKLYDEEPPKAIETHHLRSLWQSVRRYIELVWPQGDKSVLDQAEALILEFDTVDPLAQSFRYERDKKGQLQLARLPESVTLETLRSAVHDVFEFLDGCEMGLSEELSARYEMMAEFQHLYPDD
ncbi:MAG TPA: hypothetical protein VHN77_15455 [Phycisphaerales bacterium]|nr:hypothetical protein [Phycisphaerales bacterium]